MLINAVYFKGRWLDEFSKGTTRKDVFTSRNSQEKTIDFMNKTDWLNYALEDNVSIVELPYLTRENIFDKDGEYIETRNLENISISMYLMMSDGSFCPEEVLDNAEFDSKFIALSVPKFNIEYDIELSEILKTIGIQKSFDTDADFGEMFDRESMWLD